MSCRRAYELDLPAFVIDPRDPAWDEFRAHYPRCAPCAAEVAAWSALQATLAERHPEPEDLLRWNDAPAELSPDERTAIGRHVERCASCRDELRALARFGESLASQPAPASAGALATSTAPDTSQAPIAAAATDGAHHVHHVSAARAGGRHGERHAFARHGSASGESQARTAASPRDGARRGPVARVLLHPAFAYAVLALVLLLPTVRTTLDRDAGSTAFDDVAATRVAEQAQDARHAAAPAVAPAAPASAPAAAPVAAPAPKELGAPAAAHEVAAAPPAQARPAEPSARRPITGADAKTAAERSDDALGRGAALPDDAQVDRTAPRLVRQAPFRAPQAPPPAAEPAGEQPREQQPAPPAPAGMVESDTTSAAGEGHLRRESDQRASAAEAASARRDGVAATDRVRALTSTGTGAAIQLLPASAGSARTLVVILPPSAATSTDVEIRVVDTQGGRELRQHVGRPPGASSAVRTTLPLGFTAPVLHVEVYADGAGPVLQGSVTP